MTRQPHDQFAKEYLEELLTSLGKVETSKDVKSEVREIDVWFVPNTSPSNTSELGLLAKMAATSCLFEPFRNAPSEVEIRSCLLKLYTVHGDLLRQAKREKRSLSEGELPCLWILTPSCSPRMLNGFGGKIQESENWVEGVYFLPELLKGAIVAINQLPVIEDTLWLRVLGKGRTQKQAVEELVQLSEESSKWDQLLEILASWRKNIEVKDNVSDEDRELIMNLSPAYLKQREEWRQEGEVTLLLRLLRRRFGEIAPDLEQRITSLSIPQLEALVDAQLDFSNLDDLVTWLSAQS
ncbi:DUF4351 domain-containing protein [Nostoc sp. NZL]|uniref:DUF4351 domain-containing protein n=1 Tax=Nostoc sp. NZL TaxID=2650612 RepID=UPI0018C7E6C0|nr:DUF4351 domain-containing protein [Nostoc sp. NZL]MBG1244074.1 DUF4351 domain-containing protein [Nostoc sp. NZL]MBG1244932.1 DUF4351 domain-containing protein [Nostoc sp. NZL]